MVLPYKMTGKTVKRVANTSSGKKQYLCTKKTAEKKIRVGFQWFNRTSNRNPEKLILSHIILKLMSDFI